MGFRLRYRLAWSGHRNLSAWQLGNRGKGETGAGQAFRLRAATTPRDRGSLCPGSEPRQCT
jgi:hypothetical protein